MNPSSALLRAVRDLYNRHPEYRLLEPWEQQHILWSLAHVEDLADEREISTAAEVACQDWPEWWRAA